MKRILCAITALTLLSLLLTACGGPKTALEIGGARISSEIYTYYYDLVKRSPEDYPGDARENAVRLCKEYVAVNTLAAERAISLGIEQKTAASDWVNQQWKFFSVYYTRLGVSKQSLMKARETAERRALLLEAYYGAGGLQPVSEEELKAYFSEHFVVFKAINGYLTDTDDTGAPVALSDERVKAVEQQFAAMADQIRQGTAIDAVNTQYLESQNSAGTGEFTASVIDAKNTDYPEGFFEQVAAMKTNDVKVVKLSSFIYVVQKLDALGEKGSHFTQYRGEVLASMKGSDFETLLKERVDALEVAEKAGVLKNCETLVQEKRAEESGMGAQTQQPESGSAGAQTQEPAQTAGVTA